MRVVITSSEIYRDIYIEKVSFGEEGSGKKIEWKRMIDRENLIKIFKFNDEFSSVKFKRWVTWNSFELNIQDKKILFSHADSDKLMVKLIKN